LWRLSEQQQQQQQQETFGGNEQGTLEIKYISIEEITANMETLCGKEIFEAGPTVQDDGLRSKAE
jgi:hypothetical protein